MDKAIAFVCGGIGDQLYHFTQMQALAGLTAGKQIDIACLHAPIMRRITAHCDWAGRITDITPARHLSHIPAFLKFTRTLSAQRYNHAFIFHRSTSFKLAALFSGIPHRTGLADGVADRLMLSRPLALNEGGERRAVWGHRPFIAAIDAYLCDHLQNDDWLKDVPIQANDEMQAEQQARYGHLPRPWVVVNLFAQDERRRWDIQHAAQTLARLHAQHGGSFFINAGPDAVSWHQQLLALDRNYASFMHLTADSYMDVGLDIALYQMADIYLGVDSFTANLALNCDLPCVTLFAKQTDQLRYRSVCYPVYPPISKRFCDLPISVICAEVDRLLSTA